MRAELKSKLLEASKIKAMETCKAIHDGSVEVKDGAGTICVLIDEAFKLALTSLK
jgi:hypothetical protein